MITRRAFVHYRHVLRSNQLRGQFFSRGNSNSPTSAPNSSSSLLPSTQLEVKEAWIFIDSVFPIKFFSWDFRHYFAAFQEESLLTRLQSIFDSIKVYDFKVLNIEAETRDSGVFVQFRYSPSAVGATSTTLADPSANSDVLQKLQQSLREEVSKRGGIPTWTGLNNGRLFLVRGKHWREDLNRFVSRMVKVEFEGPDVHQEVLYEAFRPFGRIIDITRPNPAPAGTLRYSNIIYTKLRYAAAAQNCLYGISLPNVLSDGKLTRLAVSYEQTIKAHAIRDWLSSHPRIVLPVVAFLFGTLTYTIFDPVRIFAVEGKVLGWFDWKKNAWVQWIRQYTLDKLSFRLASGDKSGVETPQEVWRERKEAETALKSYLSDFPSTIAILHGPQGAGKWSMMSHTLQEIGRRTLIIDCAEIYKATSDSALVTELAKQTGYSPVFGMLNSLNNLIDLASIGLIGQKAGFSTSIETQLQQILEVVGTALSRVNSRHTLDRKKAAERAEIRQRETVANQEIAERVKLGLFHDGRLDCLAGNGVMSELGYGDEPMLAWEASGPPPSPEQLELDNVRLFEAKETEKKIEKEVASAGREDISGIPIVIIKNYSLKGAKRENLLEVLATWAAALVENKVAHVIVVSENRENMKRLAKALPSSPLASVALTDADSETALALVTSKLKEAGVEVQLTGEQTELVQRLGGRASDLEALTYKIKSGQKIEEAVEDIIARNLAELKKTAFGDDIDDAKNLAWSREEAWSVLKQLAKKDEIQYTEVLIEFPFKGDEAALRAMEHAELISIVSQEGRPSTIKPGKPVYRYVFDRLVKDPIFQAVQDIAFNEKAIAASDSVVRACEAELLTLKEIGIDSFDSIWHGQSATSARAEYLLGKMKDATRKIEKLEKTNVDLKAILAKGGS